MRNTVRRLLIASVLSLLGVSAGAHAFLSQAVPPVGGVVPVAPREVRLTFTEGIEPAFSRIELATADGQPIGTAPVTVDPRDNTQLVLRAPAARSRSVSGQVARRFRRYAPDRRRLHLRDQAMTAGHG